MQVRAFLVASAAVAACLSAQAAAAASWTRVPGAPEVDIDLASLRVERHVVTVWLRWPGRAAIAPELAGPGALRVNRSTVRTEFDCAHRTLRTLALHAYDASGVPVLMSSVPGPVRPVVGDELAWTYDAACEAARGAGRL